MHPPGIAPELIPRIGMSFKTAQEQRLFFSKYGEKVGFGVKLYRERPESKWVNCIKEGSCKFYKPDEDHKRKKMTKRNMCKAAIQLKKVRDQNGSIVSYTIDYVNLNHNHKLLPS
jgi:hypothetical protein